MRVRDEAGDDEPELSMAPMIDIVFQLLIFFLAATTFAKEDERALELELPRAESGVASAAVPREIVVEVLRDGRTFVGGAEIRATDLAADLRERAHGDREVPITVRGDRLAKHEAIVSVLDACGAAGLSNVSVGTLGFALDDER